MSRRPDFRLEAIMHLTYMVQEKHVRRVDRLETALRLMYDKGQADRSEQLRRGRRGKGEDEGDNE